MNKTIKRFVFIANVMATLFLAGWQDAHASIFPHELNELTSAELKKLSAPARRALSLEKAKFYRQSCVDGTLDGKGCATMLSILSGFIANNSFYWDGPLNGWNSENYMIYNVADGRVVAHSTDAVNGGQLYSYVAEKLAGVVGKPGRDGKNGTDGVNGKPGADGAKGAPGERGPEGKPGRDGKNGTDGVNGKPGTDGIKGAPGEQGPEGKPGRDGKNGTNGVDGKPGTDGVNGAPGPRGANALSVVGTALMLGAEENEKKVTTIDMSGGGNPRILSKVANGTSANDAVNLRQLQTLGAVSQSTLALANGNSNVTTVDIAGGIPGGRTLAGIKTGEKESDAVNFAQFRTEVTQLRNEIKQSKLEAAKLQDQMSKLDAQFQASNFAAKDFTLDVKAGETVYEHDLAKRVRVPNTVADIKTLPPTNKHAGTATVKKENDGRYALTFDAADFEGVTHLNYTITDKDKKQTSGRITINVIKPAKPASL